MSPDYRPLLKWFGYSRRERRSTFILLLIIVLVISIRYVLPERNISIEDISASLTTLSETLTVNNEISRDTIKSFIFDSVKGSINASRNDGLYAKRTKAFKQINENGSIQEKIIDLNNCDSIGLDKLPGIGPILSVRIIKFRNLLGGFISPVQLKEVYGLSEETYGRISQRVFADSSAVKQIDINVAGFKDLIRHPYFERYDVQAILKYRELKGSISSMEELIVNKILTPEKAARIRPYLSFGK
jgi:competence protein ComEA